MFSKNFQKVQVRAFFAVLLAVFALSVYMILPFLEPLLWAAILASIFYPLYQKIHQWVTSDSLSALLTILVVILVVLIPLLFVAGALVREVANVYEYLRDPETIQTITTFINQQRESGVISPYVEGLDLEERIRGALGTLTSSLLVIVRQGSASTLAFIAKLFVTLYTLFYFLRDGKKLLLKLERLLPFGDENERKLYARFTSTSRATLKGTIFLAIIQAAIAGLGFVVVGFPAVVFFTIIAAFFALIPALGATAVVVPAAVYLFFTASVWQALLLAVVALLINISDNVLRPFLVGGDIEMHPAIFLFATLGGLALFGISGVVFGPIVVAFLLALLEMYETRYQKDIDSEKKQGIL